MRTLSKSKLLSFRQCPKRLWLEVHRHELNTDSPGISMGLTAGRAVGQVARDLYDPRGVGQLVDPGALGIEGAIERTRQLLASAQPVFEAGFEAEGVAAFADVLLPVTEGGRLKWRMVEVKSSATVKELHRDDAAIQAFVVREAGVPLESVAIASVNANFVYLGDGHYAGLLAEEDVTDETLDREEEVLGWIAEARAVVASRAEPSRSTGSHCSDPVECGFLTYCQSRESPVEFPVAWLPRIATRRLKAFIAEEEIKELRDVPNDLLGPLQQRVKQCTLKNEVFFDAAAAAEALMSHEWPAYFLDFETIGFAVPIWAGTRPYQPITFQFSVHRVSDNGEIVHRDFLDLSGRDPREALAEALVEACEEDGPVYVYSSFERSRIEDLTDQFPEYGDALDELLGRLVDLRPIAEKCYYHPNQQGSWSIKKVLPAVTAQSYAELEGIKDGVMAMEAYAEAIAPGTPSERKAEIEKKLRAYCALDTTAMMRIWAFLKGE